MPPIRRWGPADLRARRAVIINELNAPFCPFIEAGAPPMDEALGADTSGRAVPSSFRFGPGGSRAERRKSEDLLTARFIRECPLIKRRRDTRRDFASCDAVAQLASRHGRRKTKYNCEQTKDAFARQGGCGDPKKE